MVHVAVEGVFFVQGEESVFQGASTAASQACTSSLVCSFWVSCESRRAYVSSSRLRVSIFHRQCCQPGVEHESILGVFLQLRGSSLVSALVLKGKTIPELSEAGFLGLGS